MQERKTMSVLAAALLTLAIAAPAATAKPADPVTQQKFQEDRRGEAAAAQSDSAVNPQTKTPAAQLDMHASTVTAPAPAKTDLRTEAAVDPTRAPEAPVGMPTWPVDPQPITPVAQQPVADGDGGGVDWQIPVIAIVGSLLLLGGLAVAGSRYRTSHAAG
jgi:hypothetical protein